MHEDHVRTRDLVAAGDARPDERAVMREELEVELRGEVARAAVARGRRVDAPQAPAEREIAGLDRVEQEHRIGAAVLDEQERGIALELREPEWGLEPADDRLEEVARDRGCVLDLAPGEVRRVPGQVGDEEDSGLSGDGHVRTLHLGADSKVKARILQGERSPGPAEQHAARGEQARERDEPHRRARPARGA